MDNYIRQGVSREREWEAMRRKYATYDACPDCNAIAGNPCRNRQVSAWPGGPQLRREPHPNRPLKART